MSVHGSFHTDFVNSYLEAWNAQDATGVAGHFADQGRYCDVPKDLTMVGSEIADYLRDYLNNDSHTYELHGDILHNGDCIAFQYRAYSREGGEESPEWSGAEFVRLESGVAAQIDDYYRLPAGTRSRAPAERRYAKSGLSDDAMSALMASLEELMREEEVFLDPELSLPKLAKQMGCSVNHLSQAINSGHSMSFFDYINQHRVRAAAAMLKQPDCRFPAILDVALSVGFNSTSTFYTAFKKETGQTPARYRRATG
ncbi:MAG: helix-turn-helix domain-containing protein [Pseudomonadota bacterium]